MTDKKSRRVLIINNIKSDNIDQAIFILKNDSATKASNTSVSAEAQDIIDSYIRQVERLKAPAPSGRYKNKKRGESFPWPLLFFLTSALCIGLSIALLYYT